MDGRLFSGVNREFALLFPVVCGGPYVPVCMYDDMMLINSLFCLCRNSFRVLVAGIHKIRKLASTMVRIATSVMQSILAVKHFFRIFSLTMVVCSVVALMFIHAIQYYNTCKQ